MADQIRATPRNSLAALLSDAINSGVGYMKSPQRTQQLQGLGRLIESTGIPYTVESLSYDPSGRGLFTGAGGLGGTTRMRPEALEAAMTVAPMVGPAARAGTQAAMATGRAGERVAERVVPQIMERGGMGANILQGLSNRTISPLDVYHGTPHRLPPTERNPLGEFDASKIGTGEGAQAYGYGIYTAEAPAVARGYADRLGANIISVDGKPMDFNDPVHIAASIISDPNNAGLPGKQLANAIRYDPKGIVPYGAESKVEEIAKALESGNLPKFTNQKGNFYKADLPDEQIAKMMDLDKPLIKQPYVMNALQSEAEQRVRQRLLVDIENDIRTAMPAPNIGNDYMSLFSDSNIEINKNIQKQALEKLSAINIKPLVEKELNSMKPIDMNWNITGKEYYEYLSKTQGSPEQASAMLQKQGVTGNLYLDELSRSTTEKGTRNFVVFPNEEKSIRILERNGETVANPFYSDPFGNTIPDTTR